MVHMKVLLKVYAASSAVWSVPILRPGQTADQGTKPQSAPSARHRFAGAVCKGSPATAAALGHTIALEKRQFLKRSELTLNGIDRLLGVSRQRHL